MTSSGVLQILLFFALILVCVKPLGAFMANVFEGRRTFLHPVFRWLEVLAYKAAGVREDVEHLQHSTFPFTGDQSRLSRTIFELNELQGKLSQGRFDEHELGEHELGDLLYGPLRGPSVGRMKMGQT